MSFFGGGGYQQQQQQINPQNIAMAEQELEMVTDLFNRIVDSCHKKCISREYDQNDLSQGEAVCIDRCVAKFIEVNTKVGEKMQQVGGQQQQQQ
ncbi:MAG: Tim10/DDP family zinc finger-domain-containing protein [Benjaminiella poitrasii]|nr:MAG: Tim10/DDP family zinc finger-domain-containing protein [Benjaminiella poitrasii]